MQQKNKLGALRRVEFIWIVQDTGSFEWFQSLLKNLEDAQVNPNFLRINTYLTQKFDRDSMYVDDSLSTLPKI
jgi:NADPH oxidase 1